MNALYVSDLDGTLLNGSAALSEFTRAALVRLLEEGIDFSVASARSVVSMQTILHGLRIELPVIEFNGAFLSDLSSGRHEVVNAIDGAVASDLYALVRRHGIEPFVSTFSGTEDCLYCPEVVNEGMEWYVSDRTARGDRRLRKCLDVGSALREQVVCLTSIGSEPMLFEVAASIRERYRSDVAIHFFENQYSPGWHWLTVHDRKATKGQAVRTLMEIRGLAGHELIAFGDAANDLELLGIASTAVAVGNAAPEVRERATHVIGTNEEDSVARFIDEHRRSGSAGTRRR